MTSATDSRQELRRQRRRPPTVTQEEIAARLQVDRRLYSKWEAGSRDRLPWEQDENDAWEALRALKEEKRRASG